MREVLFAIVITGLWGCASTALCDGADDWQKGGVEYKYNPFENTYEATPRGEERELKWNAFSGNDEWSYEKPGATPQYNPYENTWEFVK